VSAVKSVFLVMTALTVAMTELAALGAQIGIDALHGGSAETVMATGSYFSDFRATIIAEGNVIVPLTSFDGANLAGLDAVIVKIPFRNNSANYTPSQIAALQTFAQRAVFTSDSSMWLNDGVSGSDRPLSFGDNRQLLKNVINFISAKGILALGDFADGFQTANFNELVRPFGVFYSGPPTDAGGHTVTNFVAHPLTAGVHTVGVDLQLQMTVTSPAVDLTIDDNSDNILAAFSVPEPTGLTLGVFATGLFSLAWCTRKRHR
jgi:hypothetical protein